MIQKKIYRQRMGCICAKQSNVHDYVPENEKGNHTNVQSLQPKSRTTLGSSVSFVPPANLKENGKTRVVERPKSGPQRHSTSSSAMCRVTSVPRGAKAEQVAAGWPSWLASVAGEAIHGWTPRSPQVTSFKPQRPYKRRVAEAFKYFPSTAFALVEVLLSIDPELRGTAS